MDIVEPEISTGMRAEASTRSDFSDMPYWSIRAEAPGTGPLSMRSTSAIKLVSFESPASVGISRGEWRNPGDRQTAHALRAREAPSFRVEGDRPRSTEGNE
jgi:hypothetical protein